MIRNLSATVLFVHDLAKCTAFYRDILGFKVTVTDDVSVAFKAGSHDFVILTFAAAAAMMNDTVISVPAGAGSRVLLCADVENADAAYEALTAKGVAFIKPPVSQPWGRRTAYFADPEGNLWELFQEI